MISKVSREKIDLAIAAFNTKLEASETNPSRVSDLYERARNQVTPDSASEVQFQEALNAMDAALVTYNNELKAAGEPAVTLPELLPQTFLQTADAITNQSDLDAPPISPVVAKLKARLDAAIVGQESMREGLMVSFLTGGHILLEGPPGVGKTEGVKVLGKSLKAPFKRIQFNPDVSASDVTGTTQYSEEQKGYTFKDGPVFATLLLADEINRGVSKTQSALLEPMCEYQVTVDDNTYPVPEGFTVVATQNPLDNNGTFPLPAAQLDRFMICVKVPFATPDEELEIARRKEEAAPTIEADISVEDLKSLRQAVSKVAVPEELMRYAAELKQADPQGSLKTRAGTRAFFALKHAAQARAYLDGRTVVSEEDVRAMFPGIIRHRVELNIDAADRGTTVDDYIQAALGAVSVPNAPTPTS